MESSMLTRKSQLVLPLRVRRRMGVRPGTKIGFVFEEKRVYLQPLDKDYYKSLIGITGTKGKALRSLMEDKKKEREL